MKISKESQNNKIQTLQFWAGHAKQKKKLLVFYGSDVLDLTDFAVKHPAGQKAISCYLLQDVKNILFRVYPHPSSAVDMLRQFCIGKLKNHKEQHIQQSGQKGICKDKSSITHKKQDHSKKVSFDTSKENKTVKVNKDTQRSGKKNQSIKMEENMINFEQDKPTLLVPHFDAKFNLMQKCNNISK